MPVVAPIMKVENCKKFGATVVINGADIGESREHALVIGKSQGLMYVNVSNDGFLFRLHIFHLSFLYEFGISVSNIGILVLFLW